MPKQNYGRLRAVFADSVSVLRLNYWDMEKSNETQFYKSAVQIKDYPDENQAEVAIIGRSNAGKSSFINALALSKLAKVSQQPGEKHDCSIFCCW